MSVPNCPICHRPQTLDFRPFCSQRCARIDLGRWFGEAYAVPGEALCEMDDQESQKTGVDPGGTTG